MSRHHFIFFIAILFFGKSSIAQDNMLIGIESGINFSTQKADIDNEIDYGYLAGIHTGLSGAYSLTEKWFININFQYSQEGLKTNNVQDAQIRLHYFRFIPSIEFKPISCLALLVGINSSILIGERIRSGDEGAWNRTVVGINKRFDSGGQVGTRFYIKDFYFSANYYLGLNNILNVTYTDENGNPLDDASVKNRNFQLGLGYRISI